DEDLDTPARFLDAWSFIHMLYWGSPVLERHARGVRVVPGRAIAELEPAPYCPEAWRGSFDQILALVEKARSRPVRRFAIQWLEREYPDDLKGLSLLRLRPLLESGNEDVQTFAAGLLSTVKGIEKVPLATWMELLQIQNAAALDAICALVAKSVTS